MAIPARLERGGWYGPEAARLALIIHAMRIQGLESASDESLVDEFVRSADKDALEVLLRRHEARVFGLAYRIVGNRADALDVTQDVFLTVFRKARTFRGQSAFSTWLYRLTFNACHDLGRGKARAPLPVERLREERTEPFGSVDSRLAIEQALDKLGSESKAVILMRDVYGMSYKEISESVGVPTGTVKSRLARARLRLAELLTPGPGLEP